MTVPTNILDPPMGHSYYESVQESEEDSTSPKSMEVYHHVLNKVMDIKNEDEIELMYKGDENFTDLCVDFIKYWTIFMTSVTTEWME